MNIDNFFKILTEVCDELPDEFFNELHRGVVLSENLKISPYAKADDLVILGEYHRSYFGNQITIYYGSFERLFFYMDDDELKKKKSSVYVGCLNPGPVDTEFNKVANVKFNLKSHTPEFVCSYALKKMFKKKRLIIPGVLVKLGYIASKLLPVSVILKFVYNAQEEKM